MVQDPDHLRLIHRAHRRWVMWRILECAGIGGAMGAGVGLLVVLVLIWRNEPALSPALMTMGLGAVAGVIWGVMHRPDMLQTAMLIDRQMRLADLLSTSLLPQAIEDSEFARVVLEQAQAIAGRISVNELILARLGGRHWGGIGLSAAMVLTLALMSPQVDSTQARPSADLAQVPVAAGMPGNSIQRTPSIESGAPTRTQTLAESKDAQSGDDGSERDQMLGGGADAPKGIQGADGVGPSSSKTAQSRMQAIQAGDGGLDDRRGLTASSGGTTINDRTRSERQAESGGTVRSAVTKAAAPWAAESWPADVEAARQSVESGQVPDSYRDLVREYFTPQD